MPNPLVPAVDRATAILDLIAASGRPLRLAEIVTALALPKSSVHGLCQTLNALGLLQTLPEGFTMGIKVLHWAEAFDKNSVLLNAFRETVQQSPQLSRYTLTLSVHEGAEVHYIACRNSDAPLGLTFRAGMRLPAIYTATGKAFLAQLPEQDLIAAVTPWPKPFTPHGVANLDALRKQLEQTRQNGIGIDDSELREGMICLASTITSPNGKAMAAVSLSLTSAECPPTERAQHETVIRALAQQMAARIFGPAHRE